MKIQLIRNATMKITYAGRTILADPMLSPKGAMDPFAGIARNPTVDLPFPAEEVMKGVECVLLTHDHPDHFDGAAAALIPKDLPLFCQPGEEGRRAAEGFKSVVPIEAAHEWNGIRITRTGGEHGSGEILEKMGKVSGYVLEAAGEPIVYWIGDSLWCDDVKNALRAHKPKIVIAHAGGAVIPGFNPILMGANQTVSLVAMSMGAKVVAIHMEALDHCTITRAALRENAEKSRILPERLLIPADGETVEF